MSTETMLDLARQYAGCGWSAVPIPAKKKGPRLAGWQKLRLSEADLPQFFNGRPGNIGVLLGDASGGLVDVDLDHPLAVELADNYLPAMLLLPVIAACIAGVVEAAPMQGYREVSARWTLTLLPPAEQKSATYGEVVRPVIDWERGERERMCPLIAEAQEKWRLWRGLAEWIEAALADGGDLRTGGRWGGKLAGATIRIALVMHALAWGPFLLEHHERAVTLAGTAPATAIAERLLRWLRKNPRERLSQRDAFCAMRGGQVNRAEDVDPALSLLADTRWLRPVTGDERPGPGHKRSPEYRRTRACRGGGGRHELGGGEPAGVAGAPAAPSPGTVPSAPPRRMRTLRTIGARRPLCARVRTLPRGMAPRQDGADGGSARTDAAAGRCGKAGACGHR